MQYVLYYTVKKYFLQGLKEVSHKKFLTSFIRRTICRLNF